MAELGMPETVARVGLMTWLPEAARVRVRGIVEQGHRVASGLAEDSPYPAGTIETQIPFFRERGLDLGAFYPGTLNISIRPFTFVMGRPEFTFRQVAWTPLNPPEDFSFSRCTVEFRGAAYDGWVVLPPPGDQDPALSGSVDPGDHRAVHPGHRVWGRRGRGDQW